MEVSAGVWGCLARHPKRAGLDYTAGCASPVFSIFFEPLPHRPPREHVYPVRVRGSQLRERDLRVVHGGRCPGGGGVQPPGGCLCFRWRGPLVRCAFCRFSKAFFGAFSGQPTVVKKWRADAVCRSWAKGTQTPARHQQKLPTASMWTLSQDDVAPLGDFLTHPSCGVCRCLGESAGICRRSQTPAARSRCLQAGSRHLQMVPRHLQHASRQTQTPPRHRETHPDTRQTIAQTGALLAVTDKRRANTQSSACTARLSGTHFGRRGAAFGGVCRCLGVSGQTPQAGRA